MNPIHAMRAFVRVAESLSFHQSAQQLGIPRSTLSKQISDLEQHYAVKLLHRSTRSVALTVEGQAFYRQAVHLLAEFDELEQRMKHGRQAVQGHLRVDMPMMFAERLFIPKLPDFYARYPDIKLTLGISDRTVNLVEQSVDCVIRIGNVRNESLIGRQFAEFEFVTCAAQAYLAQYGTPQTPQALQQHRIVGYFSDSDGIQPLLFAQAGGKPYAVRDFHYAANGANGILEMIRAGLGIGQQLKAFIAPWLANGELQTLLDDYRRPPLPAYLLTRDRRQSTRLKVFSDWVVETFGDHSQP
ncbi:DNA-binding transcriptional regulator, LysR family [Pasteurella testudinis DSM 23072]|uniref:DNA-binding transcriptional regulator, LysR family n=1 Tax=Pasteurella testudinis DSM 23072 TaxID=1122938 RepID=A0A1W1V6Z7_9PAST|nr:LysR family transcriptional regulator [Pasteurella testudinis]SMB89197.1 DNA-binding transcriptional regulator, LysR family [Pasteurella testudinis DSM 23072]SUB52970.1 glycine cleavage system transcriptional activator [Pasteurella testudinis]